MSLHVVPLDDLVDHDASTDDACACGPTPKPVDQGDSVIDWLMIHHSLDGREQSERSEAMTDHRRFYLERKTDVTGASGPGRVADGVLWADGTVTLRWRGDRPSTVNWGNLDDAESVHGHGGMTRFIWLD